MLFIWSILVLDSQVFPKNLFRDRAVRFIERPGDHNLDPVWSISIDLFDTEAELDLLDHLYSERYGGKWARILERGMEEDSMGALVLEYTIIHSYIHTYVCVYTMYIKSTLLHIYPFSYLLF